MPSRDVAVRGGQRLAMYELTRPEADAHLAGRHDSGRAALADTAG